MSYVSLVQDLPQDLQMPMLKLVEAVRKDLHDQLAVRRQDFDELRVVVYDLAEAQKRTEQRLDRLEAVVTELAEAQKRTEQRLDRLEAVVAELAEAQKRTEQRVAELAEAQKRTEEEIRKLAEKQVRMDVRLSKLVGSDLERRYRERAYAYFGRILRRAQVVAWQEIVPDLERNLSDEEIEDLLLLDLLVRGQVGAQSDALEVWLALEISAVVDRNDVERAQRRAALLRKAGYRAIPTVAGEEITQAGAEAAHAGRVFLLQDGRKQFWEEALAAVK